MKGWQSSGRWEQKFLSGTKIVTLQMFCLTAETRKTHQPMNQQSQAVSSIVFNDYILVSFFLSHGQWLD